MNKWYDWIWYIELFKLKYNILIYFSYVFSIVFQLKHSFSLKPLSNQLLFYTVQFKLKTKLKHNYWMFVNSCKLT